MGTGQVDSPETVRICGAPGCDNPIGSDRRRRYCSTVCAVKVNRRNTLRRQRERRGIKPQDKVCAIEGCECLVFPPRRRHCSDVCAAKAQKEQVRRTSEISRRMKRALSKSKHERHEREVRTIRTMQNVPAERWQEYRFVKKGITQ